MTNWGMRATPGPAAKVGAISVSGLLWRRLLLAIEDGETARVAAIRTATHAHPEGEIGEFEPFFRAHERDIFTYLWRMTNDEQAAYDLAQETFLRAWRHFARIRDYERPGGWLFRVATHLALNHLRGRTTSPGGALSLDAPVIAHHAALKTTAVSDPATRVADSDTVRRAMIAISPRHRAALILREIYGLSCGEVATTLGISAGAAKTLLWRAREEFRSRYAEEARS